MNCWGCGISVFKCVYCYLVFGLVVVILIVFSFFIINALKEAKSMFGRKKELEEIRDDITTALNRTIVHNINDGENYDCRNYIDVAEAIRNLRGSKASVAALEHVDSLLKRLAQRVDDIDKNTESLDLVDCEGCGCLILRDKAIRGESVIEKESGIERDMAVLANYTIGTPAFTLPEPKESIREVFWCKCCGEDV